MVLDPYVRSIWRSKVNPLDFHLFRQMVFGVTEDKN